MSMLVFGRCSHLGSGAKIARSASLYDLPANSWSEKMSHAVLWEQQ